MSKKQVHGVLAEFTDVDSLQHAAGQVRQRGPRQWDAYTPFPVHGLDTAMGIRKTRLPFAVLIAGICGLLFALWMQWWMDSIDYPYRISGKPLFSLPAFVPIMFECTVLFSVFASFFGTLGRNGLPRLFHPLFRLPRFRRATNDRFFIYVEAEGAHWNVEEWELLFKQAHASAVEVLYYDYGSDAGRIPPKGSLGFAVAVVVLSLIPFALIARSREQQVDRTRIHVFFDMDNQEKFKPQSTNTFFPDHRAMRVPPEGTVAVGSIPDEKQRSFYTGKDPDSGAYIPGFPEGFVADATAIQRGKERFQVHCTPCHGLAGYGDGLVSKHAEALMEGTWVPPSSLHDDRLRGLPNGELFNTITYGVRNMPGYAPEIEPVDRWRIILYVRALQMSQHAPKSELTPEIMSNMTP